MIKTKLFVITFLFALFAFPVFAKEEKEDSFRRFFSREKVEEREEKREEKRDENKTRLTEGRLKSCEARENAINTRSDSLERMVNNMIVKFEAITERVENFYTEKVIPTGVTVENYDDLVSDINAKKEIAKNALTNAQEAMDDFSCDSDDPKGLFTTYKENMQAVKDALKEYRTSIKNLIVTVHSAVEENEEETEN